MDCPAFRQCIMATGKNDTHRSEILGIPPRTLQEWRAGKLPTNLVRLMQHPQLLRALADDAERNQTTEPTTPSY